jgi:hypothetical protein
VGFVLSAMGDQLDHLVDVTVVYPDGTPSFWDFLCGRVPRVIVDATVEPLPAELTGRDYELDDGYRLLIREWIDERWDAKDERIEALLRSPDDAPGARSGPGP